jgi:hypothetical protein
VRKESRDQRRESRVEQVVQLANSEAISSEVKEQVLWRLVTGIEGHIASMRRWTLVMVCAGVLFELIHRNQLGEFAIFGLKARELTSMLYVAPIIISCGYAAMVANYLEFRAMLLILDTYADHAFRDLRASRVLEALLPSILWLGGKSHLLPGSVARRPDDIAASIQTSLATAGPFIFLPYVFIVLFGMRDSNSVATWMSLAATLVVLCVGIGFADAATRTERNSK